MARPLSVIRRRPTDAAEDHEQLFVAHYRSLRAQARRLVGGDAASAEDLMQDAYIAFVVARPDLDGIANLGGYLATVVRNVHISRMRRKANQRVIHVPIEEYDSAELALGATRPDDRVVARNALVLVCQHVCARKDGSKAASVLALRFFHGFYPTEIARIVGVPGRAVHDWLWQARTEAQAMLADSAPSAPAPARRLPWHVEAAMTSDDPAVILRALQKAIFATVRPPCLTTDDIRARYERGDATPLGISMLSHLASCRRCLDRVSVMLGLPPLDERSSLDPKDSSSGGDPGAPSALPLPFQRVARRRVRDVLEHRPRELQISVNGLPVGILAAEAARNRVSWTVRADEPLTFADVHSEQGLRMALLSLSPPTDGALVQAAHVALTDHRWIDVSIDFSETHPAITVEYVDPSFATAPVRQTPCERHVAMPVEPEPAEPRATGWRDRWSRIVEWWTGARAAFLIPAAGLLAVTTVAGMWWSAGVLDRDGPASSLVARAAEAEAGEALPADLAAHGAFDFAVRRLDTGIVESSHRIETWIRGASRLRAIRVFDATGGVVAGQWTDRDGQETRLALGPLDEVWQQPLSAAAFRDHFIGGLSCGAHADAAVYTVVCDRPVQGALLRALSPDLLAHDLVNRPSRAELVLRRADLHVLRETLTISLEGVDRQVTLDERSLTRVPVSAIPADAFVPVERPRVSANSPSLAIPSPSSVRASPSLEMRLVEIVDRLAGAEYVSVRRAPNGRVAVAGLVSAADQKRALATAVAVLDKRGAVALDVRTFAEEQARQRTRREDAPDGRLELRELTAGPAPVQEYIEGRVPAGTDAAAVVRELAPRVLAASRSVRRDVSALGSLASRFPDDTRASLDLEAQRAWQQFVTRRTTECLGALEGLDASLAPYFSAPTDTPASPPDSIDATLHTLAHTASVIDQAVNEAFTVSDRPTSPVGGSVMNDLRQHIRDARADVRALQQLTGR
ncbi:MAG: sigma-70 family RNA polymerase sigma factor [Vicinamibacterales bacterium]